MSKKVVSAVGERGAIAGYLPQFDEFASLVYKNLVSKQLEWIKIADPEAEKLDDIQYSTFSEVHAYQVKWTISDEIISFNDFCNLIPKLASSWVSLKSINQGKIVVPHLITNKLLSKHDSIENGANKIGSFNNFIDEVWYKIKIAQSTEKKWNPIVKRLKKLSKLNSSDFLEFIKCFDFQFDYKQKEFSASNLKSSKEDKDLIQISRFLFEEAGGKKRNVKFSRLEIISILKWRDRFETLFSHDLIIDRQTYQPILATEEQLNLKLDEFDRGYIYLIGGPGTGKSSLLTNWSRQREERIIKYYAFDFQSPSSQFNFFERGESTTLFFDLVYQLKDAGIYNDSILPHRDITFLKNVFFNQLKSASEEFLSDGRKTIIIIDGLDHLPREYRSAKQSFLTELILPDEIPQGIYIILGSQNYNLEGINTEIKKEFNENKRTIQIENLSKIEVFKYLDKINIKLDLDQKTRVFEKTQGHPLYLTYLIEKIQNKTDVDFLIETFENIEGSIDNYYNKIWGPIQIDDILIEFMGLISRINGAINLLFIQEWRFDFSILRSFDKNAKFLFNQNENDWSFFHNSFRQFLLEKTSINPLTDKFDEILNITYHKKLADYYDKSQVEPSWKQNFHLFKSENFDEFIVSANPESFTSQFIQYRPIKEIKQEAKLGIEISRRRKDLTLLTRYLFSLAEIEKRSFNIDPASFTEELILFNKIKCAKNYLRTNSTLHCSPEYALEAARLFFNYKEIEEARLLFNLAYPEYITERGIVINDLRNYVEIREILEEWGATSPLFLDLNAIINIINNIKFKEDIKQYHQQESEFVLRLRILTQIGYSLVYLEKWVEFDSIIKQLNLESKEEIKTFYLIVNSAIERCLEITEIDRANEYLIILLNNFKITDTSNFVRINIANLIFKVSGDINSAYKWITDIPQPKYNEKISLGYDDSIDEFIPLIKLNKILNLSGNGVSIIQAVPGGEKGSEERVLVEFARMLCLCTQILCDGIQQIPSEIEIKKRVLPIVKFYYQDISIRNKYIYKLRQSKGSYFDFLVYSVSKLDLTSLDILGDYLFQEFLNFSKYWDPSLKRKIIKSLLNYGFNKNKARLELIKLEENMFQDLDIDGRITECVAHSKAWIQLDELEIAEKWIKEAIKESIGIGYSKDYQFSTWIDWLSKINFLDKKGAEERIKWFLSHLDHIKQTTEGRAYWVASKDILKTTFDWNFSAGFTQLKWQLDNTLIGFEDSISVFIESYVNLISTELEFKGIIQLYSEIFLLISEDITDKLLIKILEKGYSIMNDNFLKIFLPKLIASIEINALEQNRHLLLITIEEFCALLNLTVKDYYPQFEIPKKKKNSQTNSSNSLELKGQKSLSEEEVFKEVSDYEKLKEIIQDEDQVNSYFSWSRIFEEIHPLLNLVQIEEISSINKIGSRASEFYSKLSEVALVKGSKQLALTLANKSLELSTSSGWSKYYDGGTRINSLNALKKIDSNLAIDKAFNIFCHDVISGDYPSTFIEHLDDILPILKDDLDITPVWDEIFTYLKSLMSNSTPIKELPEFKLLDKSISDVLDEYLLYLVEFPTSIINEKAKLLISKRINNGNIYLLKKITKSNIDEDIVTDVMMLLFEFDSNKIIKFKKTAIKLATSNNYLIRKNASKVLSKLNERIPTVKKKEALELYSFYFPEPKKIKLDSQAIENNLEQLVSPFGSLVNILSKESEIDKVNLLFRINFIMKEISEESEWSDGYEKTMRGYLEEINIKFPCSRSRVRAANKAVLYLVSELIDSDLIDDTERIQNVVRSYDYKVYTFNKTSKPNFIQKLSESEFGGVGKDWISRVENSSRLDESLLSVEFNKKIIGEYSLVKNLDWGTPTEIYMSQIANNKVIDGDDYYIFGSMFQTLTEKYYDLISYSDKLIVVRDHRFNQFDLKSRWIAINPDLARFLEWEPEPSKLFAWKDKMGRIMVESIYWSNGIIDSVPRKDCEIGEGWYVLASEEALNKIQSIVKVLFIQKSLARQYYKDSILTEKTINKIIEYIN